MSLLLDSGCNDYEWLRNGLKFGSIPLEFRHELCSSNITDDDIWSQPTATVPQPDTLSRSAALPDKRMGFWGLGLILISGVAFTALIHQTITALALQSAVVDHQVQTMENLNHQIWHSSQIGF